MKRTPLKRKAPLKSKTRLRKISPKQKAKLALWRELFLMRVRYLIGLYGTPVCEYCKKPGVVYEGRHEDLMGLDPHHADGDRSNNTYANCMILHRLCHSLIHDNNIKVIKI